GHVDADLADRRMCQEVAPEERVMLGLHGAALPRAFDALGAAAAGAVQGQPVSAGLEPLLNRPALRGVGIRPGDVGDEQPTRGQPFLDVGEVVGDRGGDVLLRQEPEQPQAGVVVVVPGGGSRRQPTGDELRGADVVLLPTDLSVETGTPSLTNCVEGTPDAGFPDEIAPRSTDYVYLKRRPSAFYGTGVAELLRTLRRSGLVIAGGATNRGVET